MPHCAQIAADPGFALFVRPENSRWIWTLMNLDAEVAARGEAADRETAWRTGEFAAAAVGALGRVGKRSF
ncbi:MAG: hypothetical protein GC145_19155 [Caulobacter sp.]|nr:hypothetical protein [Caulobacter sp.]